MKKSILILGVCLAASVAFGADEKAKAENLFNGKDLTGWDGDPKLWSVRDGMIVGRNTAEDPLPYNKFLIWEGEPVENFVFTAKVRVIGDSNSGIQYRSKRMPDAGEYVVGGYQCDIHPSQENHGMLYEEKGRGITAKRGMTVVVTPGGEKLQVEDAEEIADLAWGQWHTYRIRARGNVLVHEVDGVVAAKITDHEETARALSGILAFQVHRGPPMEVHIKDVRLRRLPAGGIVGMDKTPIPEDAKPVMPPRKPKGKGKGKK